MSLQDVSDMTTPHPWAKQRIQLSTVDGELQTRTALTVLEKAAVPLSPVAAMGQIWCKNSVPNALMFTDDTGVDYQLAGASGGSLPSIALTAVTNQIVLGTTNTTTINSVAPSASRVYTIQDAGSASNIQTGTKSVITLPASGNTILTASQSGTVLFIPQQTANNSVTLPALQAGLNFEFYVTATANGSNTCTISSAVAGGLTGKIIGPASDADIVSFAAKNSLILSATAANVIPGDFARLVCNGTQWYVEAVSGGTAVSWSAP